MTLTLAEIDLLRASYQALREQDEAASTTFYEELFRLAPKTRELFRGDITDQGMKFFAAIKVILDRLDNPADLRDSLDNLAKGHAAVGITAADFEPMGEALIATMRDTLGPDLRPRTEAAWRKAYDLIADAMIEAGDFPAQPR